MLYLAVIAMIAGASMQKMKVVSPLNVKKQFSNGKKFSQFKYHSNVH
jgi:hypothetical protein